MTKEQIEEARSLIGKMPRDEIAREVGVSVANLKRTLRGTRIVFHNKYVANPDLVKRVCAYYEKHGKIKTQKAFPDINVRSVVERYKYFKPRQTRWTGDQLCEAVKMSGLVSMKAQAKFFNRPNAFEGSIRSLWMKRFGFGGGSIHGMSERIGKQLVKEKCPLTKTRFWSTRRLNQSEFSRGLFLWCDMEKHLAPDIPPFIRDAIFTMADFQRWLYQTDNPRRVILSIIRERDK